MDFPLLYEFLSQIESNNNREWFQRHKATYDTLRLQFLDFTQSLINKLVRIDPSIAYLRPQDTIYRFYRDTRFSADKSPYKRHFGTFINARGKKSITGGYYLHLQPNHSFAAVGSYYLPSNILNQCRKEIDANQYAWNEIIHNTAFLTSFGSPAANASDSFFPKGEKGFGLNAVKTAPKGFKKDHPLIDSLRLKDYCAWHSVEFNEQSNDDLITDQALHFFEIGKPLHDFTNPIIEDMLS